MPRVSQLWDRNAMNLRQIEIFHAVFLHGTVSAAARSLNVSQPSVTKVLRHAERSIGLTLFERSKGRLIPTKDAHTLFAEVSDIQDRVRSLRQACQILRHGRGGLRLLLSWAKTMYFLLLSFQVIRIS